MRILDPAMVNELNRLESDHVMTMAAQLEIIGAPGAYRFVNYDQDITFRGLLYTKASFAVDSLEEATSAALVHIQRDHWQYQPGTAIPPGELLGTRA